MSCGTLMSAYLPWLGARGRPYLQDNPLGGDRWSTPLDRHVGRRGAR